MTKIFAFIKSNIAELVVLMLTILAIIFIVKLFLAPKQVVTPGTVIIHDTTTIVRYDTEVQRDTIIKWYEKIIKVEREPEKIYIQKIDSVFLEKIKYHDLMLKVDKKGNTLKIFAVNEKDSTLKEYFFHGIYNNFTATSATGKIFVTKNKF